MSKSSLLRERIYKKKEKVETKDGKGKTGDELAGGHSGSKKKER